METAEAAVMDRVPIDQSVLLAQLGNATGMRSSQDQILWVVIGTFWATNAILLVALFQTGQFPDAPVGVALGTTGLVVSGVWYGMQRRALAHLVRLEALIRDLEQALYVPPSLAISLELNQLAYERYLRGGISARQLMRIFTAVSLVAWLALALVSCWALLSSQS